MATDIDEWVDSIDRKYDWTTPGMVCQLYRIHPEWYKGFKTGGLITSVEGNAISINEIMEKYGGGEFEMVAIIPPIQSGHPICKRKNRFNIAGAPKLDSSSDSIILKTALKEIFLYVSHRLNQQMPDLVMLTDDEKEELENVLKRIS